ncbi:MAG TPA: chalcone isomerase family protein [Gammaproteobacteria bacterium]|nr:chalcone isomerase family protein [Gammaproteobacteria bacterium]
MSLPHRHALAAALVALLVSLPAVAANPGGVEVNGVQVPGTLERAGQKLVLNGAGVRTRWFIDAYVGALYLPHKESDAQKIIAADQPMAITMHITTHFITPGRMKHATMEGFRKATHDNIEPIKPKIERLIHVFDKNIDDGDVYTLLYVPHEGTRVYKNGKPVLAVQGLKFKQALFGIWLCDKPAEASLKKAMLGTQEG